MSSFETTLFSVLKTVNEEFDLNLLSKEAIELRSGTSSLLSLDKNHFRFVDRQILNHFIEEKNSLTDAFVENDDLKVFCNHLLNKNSKPVLNHIGFCYQVGSKNLEKNRLASMANTNRLHLYEMPSSDASLWLFLGDKYSLSSPMIEFLPVEKVEDYYLDYWLPHIHLALHTSLNVEAIKHLTHEAFKGNRTANPTTITNNVIYQLRVWLGTVSGINIDLDLLTNERWNSLEDTRKMLKTLV